MKSSLFIRPNLKAFLFAAVVIAALKEVVLPADPVSGRLGFDPAPGVLASADAAAQGDAVMEQLKERALAHPDSRLFARISEGYRLRGDYRQAMLFMRKAYLAAELESLEE